MERVIEDDITSLTVSKLKKELEKHGLPLTGTKSILLDRLRQYREKDVVAPVSPEPSKVTPATSAQSKRPNRPNFESPTKRKATALFTQEENTSETSSTHATSSEEPPAHVPIYLYNKVEYRQKGESELSPAETLLSEFIASNVKIPRDFESNKRYGSLSGTSYEERALISYVHGLFDEASLSPKASEGRPAIRKAVINGDLDAAAKVAALFSEAGAN